MWVGLWAGCAIGFITEYFTSHTYRPTRDVAKVCALHPAPHSKLGGKAVATSHASPSKPESIPLSSEYGTYNKGRTRFRPWLLPGDDADHFTSHTCRPTRDAAKVCALNRTPYTLRSTPSSYTPTTNPPDYVFRHDPPNQP